MIESAPKMPVGFYGKVEYSYQNGKLITAKVERIIKPAD